MTYIPVKTILEMIIRSPAMNTMSVQWELVCNHIRVIVEAHRCRAQVGKLVLYVRVSASSSCGFGDYRATARQPNSVADCS
jgi:hypothetical protein